MEPPGRVVDPLPRGPHALPAPPVPDPRTLRPARRGGPPGAAPRRRHGADRGEDLRGDVRAHVRDAGRPGDPVGAPADRPALGVAAQRIPIRRTRAMINHSRAYIESVQTDRLAAARRRRPPADGVELERFLAAYAGRGE